MKRAESIANASNGSISVAQAFEQAAAADPALFQKAKQRAGTVDPDFDNDADGADDIDETDDDPDDDPSGGGGDGIGIPPFEGASGDGRGKSPAVYDNGGANVATHPKPAVFGATEGSYDPKARPRSALSKADAEVAFRKTLAKKLAKVMIACPTMSTEDQMALATKGRKVRQAYQRAYGFTRDGAAA